MSDLKKRKRKSPEQACCCAGLLLLPDGEKKEVKKKEKGGSVSNAGKRGMICCAVSLSRMLVTRKVEGSVPSAAQ